MLVPRVFCHLLGINWSICDAPEPQSADIKRKKLFSRQVVNFDKGNARALVASSQVHRVGGRSQGEIVELSRRLIPESDRRMSHLGPLVTYWHLRAASCYPAAWGSANDV
jgi:hypothetical protein